MERDIPCDPSDQLANGGGGGGGACYSYSPSYKTAPNKHNDVIIHTTSGGGEGQAS